MEQINQPRGDKNEITTHDEPVIYDGPATEARPPVTFAEAEQHNAFTLLAELHHHALTFDAEHGRPQDASHHLAELALSSAVVSWWSRWQPISMHRAFLAGASLTEVAAAAGASETEAYEHWSRWAEAQAGLHLGSKLGVDPAEADAIRTRLDRPDSTT